jgi:hypothetical protein
MISSKIKTLVPYLLIILAVLLFYPTIWIFNHTFISSGMVLTDLYLFNYPLKDLMHKSLMEGQGIPLWTDLIGNGYPIFAEGQMGAMYPLHLLFFVLTASTIKLFNLNLLFHLILAGIFTYLYIYKKVKLSQSASVFGAIIYMFCGYIMTHLHQVNIVLVIIYFPLNLYIVEEILALGLDQEKQNLTSKTKKFLRLTVISSLVLFLQVTVGHVEMAYYNLLFTAIYTVIRIFFNTRLLSSILLKLSLVVISVIISLLLALPQILSTYELVNFSQRESGLSFEHTTGTLWPLEKLILFINPKAFPIYYADPTYRPDRNETVNIGALYPYIGILPLLLSLYAVASLFTKKQNTSKSKDPKTIWTITFFTLALFTYLYAVGRSTQLFAVVWEIVPGLKFFRYPVKGIYIIEFSLAILAAIGIDRTNDFIINKIKTTNKIENKNNTQKSEIGDKNIHFAGGAHEHIKGNYAGKISIEKYIILTIIVLSYADLWVFNRPIQPTIPSEEWLKPPEFAKEIQAAIKKENSSFEPNRQTLSSFTNWRVYTHGTNNVDFTRIFDYTLQKELQNILHVDYNMTHNIPVNKEWAVLFLQRQSVLNRINTSINMDKGELGLSDQLKKSLDLQATRYLLSDLPIVHPDLELTKTIELTKPFDHILYLIDSQTERIKASKVYLYENKAYYPRINIIPQSNTIQMLPADKQATNIYSSAISEDFDPTKMAILEKDGNTKQNDRKTLEDNLVSNQASYKVLKYSQTEMQIEYSVKQPSIFSLADTYYPGWKAYIDGEETQIYKGNYAFRAVEIPEGEHTLFLKFEPTYWNIGLKGTIIGAALLVSTSVLYLVTKIKPKKGATE